VSQQVVLRYRDAVSSEIWTSDAYLRASMPRTQAVLDLLGRVRHPRPRLIADLGCGPGNNTELIAGRWPEALVIGVDSSAGMIAAARKRERPGHLEFRQADLTAWQPGESFDIVLLNAVLQWLPGHVALLPRLCALLAPGGVLGFQMPGRLPGRSDVYVLDIAREMTGEPEWRDKISDVYTSHDLLDATGYITALGDLGLRAEGWETRYTYPLTGGSRLVEYAAGAVLRPALAPLTTEEAERFVAEFSRRVSLACPPQVIGGESVEVLHQSRVFVIGQLSQHPGR
jgi:trans-aconitate 2-methyltransferase